MLISKKNIYLVYESQILDTGGGVKNSIKYFDSKNFLVVNADIYWDESNINDVNNFIDIIDQFENYFLLLSNQKNTIGIERSYGDFVIHNDYVRRWMEGDPVIFFSGLQILNPKIFDINGFNSRKSKCLIKPDCIQKTIQLSFTFSQSIAITDSPEIIKLCGLRSVLTRWTGILSNDFEKFNKSNFNLFRLFSSRNVI